MSNVAFQKPVEDSVSRVNSEVAVGEDLGFQQRWWKFETFVWSLFALILVLDLAGFFGRGPVAHHHLQAADKSLNVKYDRIARAESPTIMDLQFSPDVISNGKVTLFVSESLVKELGTQRVIPSPESSAIGNGGITYTFPATASPAAVQFAMQPSGPGLFHFTLRAANADPVQGSVLVMP